MTATLFYSLITRLEKCHSIYFFIVLLRKIYLVPGVTITG